MFRLAQGFVSLTRVVPVTGVVTLSILVNVMSVVTTEKCCDFHESCDLN